MGLITISNFDNLRCLLGNISLYKAKHSLLLNEIKDISEIGLFAVPKNTENQKIVWFSEKGQDYINFSKLREEQKASVLLSIDKIKERILKRSTYFINPELKAQILDYFEIPSLNDIYCYEVGGELFPILTNWGAIADNNNANRGLISKNLPKGYVDVILQTVFPNGNPAPNSTLFIDIGVEKEKSISTDHTSMVSIGKWKIGTSFITYQLINEIQTKVQEFVIEDEQQICQVFIDEIAQVTFILKDTNGDLYSNKSLKLTINELLNDFNTNDIGQYKYKDVAKGEILNLSGVYNDIAYSYTCTCNDAMNFFTIELPLPIVKELKIKVIDHKNKPISSCKVNVLFADKSVIEQYTDIDGFCRFDLSERDVNQKMKIISNWKEKIRNKTYKFDSGKNEVLIKYGKFNYLWLLMLLLLFPLLLLIRIDKKIDVQTLNAEKNNSSISGVEVNYYQIDRSLLSLKPQFKLFAVDTIIKSEISDSTGYARFNELSYTLFKRIFFAGEREYIIAKHSCLASDTLYISLHKIDEDKPVDVYMWALKTQMQFVVVDKEDNQPLPNAQISFYEDYGNTSSNFITDPDGRVWIDSIAKCSKYKVVASLHGYYPDSIQNDVANSSASDTLRLMPIRKPIKFYVKDLVSKHGISGAICNLTADGVINPAVVYTNSGGLAKIVPGFGEFVDIKILSNIEIKASKQPEYNDSSTIALSPITAERYMTLSDDERTIYLRSLPNPIYFRDIDERTKKPLSGVTNIIEIQSADGSKNSLTIMSNQKGIFMISAKIGDRISIISDATKFVPAYILNDYTIKNADYEPLSKGSQNDRDIPLRLVPPPMVTFKDVDANTGGGIAGVQNNVVGCSACPKAITSQANGEFVIDFVYPHESISITASKSGYTTNNTKIVNQKMGVLQSLPQSDRNIPLSKIIVNPCTGGNKGTISGKKTVSEVYYMGANSGSFLFDYYTDSAPDEIIVKCNECGKQLFYFNGATNNDRPQVSINFCHPFILVTVNNDTNWDYSVHCPTK